MTSDMTAVVIWLVIWQQSWHLHTTIVEGVMLPPALACVRPYWFTYWFGGCLFYFCDSRQVFDACVVYFSCLKFFKSWVSVSGICSLNPSLPPVLFDLWRHIEAKIFVPYDISFVEFKRTYNNLWVDFGIDCILSYFFEHVLKNSTYLLKIPSKFDKGSFFFYALYLNHIGEAILLSLAQTNLNSAERTLKKLLAGLVLYRMKDTAKCIL